MRRIPSAGVVLAALLISSVACTGRDGRERLDPDATAYPKGTGETVETAASRRFSERLSESRPDLPLLPWSGEVVLFDLPFATIAEALSPHLLSFNDTRRGAGAYCLEQGTLSADQLVRKRFPDDLFYPCAASYFAQFGVSEEALTMFAQTHISVERVLSTVGPISLALGMDWTTYGMNDDRPVFVFTPQGVMQPYYNLPWEPHLRAVIAAASSSLWKQIEDERSRVEDEMLDIGFYGTTDTDVGVLSAVGDTYELPTETGLLYAHCCDYPYTVRMTYVFDASGTPIDVRFDGFCWSEGWIVNRVTGDPAIDVPPRRMLPGCTLRTR